MKDEAGRYLRSVLEHNVPFLDDLFVWDDQSMDGSRAIARGYTDHVFRREDTTPSFIEHEGKFRFEAWRTMEVSLAPEDGDWILAFDADEFLVLGRTGGNVSKELRSVIEHATTHGTNAVVLPFPEIFEINDGVPQYRIDGLWNTVQGPRLFRYQTGGEWSSKSMGCGAEPTYVVSGKHLPTSDHNLYMLHYGYADPKDHAVKHKRYSELQAHGHNNAHVQSIITKSTLVPWEGQVPEICE